MEIPLLQDLAVIFSLAIIIIFVCHKLKISSIVGLLIVGILAGPHGLVIIKSTHDVEMLAEIGIILLLFTIGIDFSFEKLNRIKKLILGGGTFQVLITIIIVLLISLQRNITINKAIFFGFIVALSSTAIVLKILQERNEMDSPHGRIILGILIFQDLIIVPMMLVTPFLAGSSADPGSALITLILKGLGIILLVIVSTRWLVPNLLFQISRTRSRELFMLSLVVICLLTAWLTSSAGLSLALGAFLAGLVISESEYSYHAMGNIIPFKDVFTSLFFVSVGMLLNIKFFFSHIWLVLILVALVLIIKMIIAGLITLLLGYSIRTAVLVGVSISQIGEFSFILSKVGNELKLLDATLYQLILNVSILTILITPFYIAFAPILADLVTKISFLPSRLKSGSLHLEEKTAVEKKRDHLVIIGFGLNGRNLARAAKATKIPYVVLDMNPETVKNESKKGEPIYYGDATYATVLNYLNIKEARVVVVAINDPAATRIITDTVHRVAPSAYIVVRTRYVYEMEPLYELGADVVIPEEFETSIEIFTRVLKRYLVSEEEINNITQKIRTERYEMFRNWDSLLLQDIEIRIPDIKIDTFKVDKKSKAAEKSLAELQLRREHDISVLAILKGEKVVPNPHGDIMLNVGDKVIVLGKHEKVTQVSKIFRASGNISSD